MNKIIIDLEFNGLYHYNFIPEINQVKIYNLTNDKFICQSYRTKNKQTFGSLLITGEIHGNTFFSKEEFIKLIKKVEGTIDDKFIGFSIKTDKKILWEYGIDINYTLDLQEKMMLSKYESVMALNGRSMETCYYILFKEDISVSHNGIEEIYPLIKIYNKIKNLRCKKYLTLYPWGDDAGMPLENYIENNRRKADGYRYNNNDILAKSLDHYIETMSFEEDDWW